MNRLLLFILLLPLSISAQVLQESFRLNNETGLSQNSATDLCLDGAGRIWIGTSSSLHTYNGFSTKLVTDVHSEVLGLALKDGMMYCITTTGAHIFNANRTQQNMVEWDKTNDYSHAFLDEGIALLNRGTNDYLFYDYNLEKQKWPSSVNKNSVKFSENAQSFDLKKGKIECDTDGIRITGEQAQTVSSSFNHAAIKYEGGRIFLASNEGLIEVIENSLNGDISIKRHFRSERIESLLLDKNGNLWVGTSDHGVFLVHRNALHAEFYPLKTSSSTTNCYEIFEYDNKLHVATTGGVLPLGSHFSYLNAQTKGLHCTAGCNAGGMVIVGTAFEGLHRYLNGQFIRVYSTRDDSLANYITHVIQIEKGFLASSKRGFVQLSTNGKVVNLYSYEGLGIDGHVNHFVQDGEGYRAAATSGVYFLNADMSIQRKLASQNGAVTMTTIFDGKLYCSTTDGSVCVEDGGKLSPEKSLANELMSIVNHKNADLWLSSSSEIIQYQKEVYTYGLQNGFPLSGFNQHSQYTDDSGQLYFGGNGGVVRFHPKDFPPRNLVDPVFQVSTSNGVLTQEDTLIFEYTVENLVLKTELVAITDKANSSVSYQLDSTTVDLNGEDQVLLELPYGESEITFKVLKNGAKEPVLHHIKMLRAIPFYAEWWFKAAILLLAVVLLIGIISFFRLALVRALLRKERSDKHKNEERLVVSRELHNDLAKRFTTLIAVIKKGGSEPVATEAMATDSLEHLRETMWAVRDEDITFHGLLKHIKNYPEQNKTLSKVDVRLIKGDVADFDMNPVQAIGFFRIAKEALKNTVQHADTDELIVKVEQEKNEIILTFQDKGKGFNVNAMREGEGVRAMKSFAKQVDAEFKIMSSPGAGTEIFVTFKK